MLNVAFQVTGLYVPAEQILLAILIPIVKLILVIKTLVESTQSVKVKAVVLFVSVLEDLLVTHSHAVMIILVIKTLVEPMLIVKMQEIELFVNAGRVTKEIRLCNVL